MSDEKTAWGKAKHKVPNNKPRDFTDIDVPFPPSEP